jgi:methylenetetrahydrofolate dehydrogenase (NADP+) / methenyltetrahydrofolate cyclohydrolase
MIINGRVISSEILEDLKIRVAKLNKIGIVPTLAVILIGDQKASAIYVRQKEIKAKEVGISPKVFYFNDKITNKEIETLVKKLDQDPKIHGIILQRPAPKQINVEEIEEFISPVKEVDGFGLNSIYPVPVAAATLRMIENVYENLKINKTFIDWLKSKKIIVIGKGETGGKTIIKLLQKNGVEPFIVDSKTENKDQEIKKGDIVISAVGKRGIVTGLNLKKGVILIGVGIFSEDGKTRGDYDAKEVENIASFYSPTPGGVGPVNVSMLMENLVEAAEKLSKLDKKGLIK